MIPPSLALAPLNHLLHGAGWARRNLQPWAGKTVHLRLPPLPVLALTVQADGAVAPTSGTIPADAALTLSPSLLPRLLARDGRAYDEIRVSGDCALADAVLHVGKHLHWDVEHDLSRVVGDVAAHRLARMGDRLTRWPTATAGNLAAMLTEYLTEERALLAKPAALRVLAREADALRADAVRLEARIRALSAVPVAGR